MNSAGTRKQVLSCKLRFCSLDGEMRNPICRRLDLVKKGVLHHYSPSKLEPTASQNDNGDPTNLLICGEEEK